MELLRWIGHWVLFFFASIILFHYCHRYTVPSRAPLENEGQTFLLLGSVACGQCLAVKNCHPGSSLAIQWLGLTQQFHWGSIPGEGTKDPASCVQFSSVQFSSVQSLSCVWLFVIPWTEACQASLSITNSRSLLKLMYIELVMPSNHPILCCPLLLLPSIFPNIRVFSNESALHIRWPE